MTKSTRKIYWPYYAIIGLVAIAATFVLIPTNVPKIEGYTLIYADEFNDDTLDTSIWKTCYYFGCTHASMSQYYNAGDVSQHNGSLVLRARRQNMLNKNFTSGMVTSDGNFSFLYGRIDVRFKTPAEIYELGTGVWPAVWMMPQNHEWPPEVDINEYRSILPTTAHQGFHYVNLNSSTGRSQISSDRLLMKPNDWNNVTLIWEPGHAVWYVNGQIAQDTYNINVPSLPMYLIACFQLGGRWAGGTPPLSVPFPQYYLVDYVRVYQKTDNLDYNLRGRYVGNNIEKYIIKNEFKHPTS